MISADRNRLAMMKKMISAKLCSFTIVSALAVAVVAASAAFFLNVGKNPLIFSDGSTFPSAPLPSTLTEEQLQTFQETGVLFLPGLLRDDMLEDAMTAAENVFRKPSLMGQFIKSHYAKLTLQEWRSSPGLARVAFESSISSMAADLLRETNSIRILKDALFGQTKIGVGCGFHVDNIGFWPADSDSTGVNFWIALSDYNATTGGGIRVAPGSQKANWAPVCREVVLNGTIRERKTCRMSELSPDCDAKLTAMSVVYDMKPGDAIVWDRWIFHRSEPFKMTALDSNEHKLRYTIRFIPSNALAAGLVHDSVEIGKPFHTPYHPQVWPTALSDEMEAIRKGLDSDDSFRRNAYAIWNTLMSSFSKPAAGK